MTWEFQKNLCLRVDTEGEQEVLWGNSWAQITCMPVPQV